MGWKLSSIIINPKTDVDFEDLLNKLGFKNLIKVETQSYEDVMYPESDKVYIGFYKNNLIISADKLPVNFYETTLSNKEKILIDNFPNSEICAVSLQSTINHFGFAIISNGEKIRVKAGDAELGTVIDIGEPLNEEKLLLSQSEVTDNGERLYFLDDNLKEPYLENQVGENFVFEIFKRYTGELLNADEELLDTDFTGFKYSEDAIIPDKYFSGEWHGHFTYGDGYSEIVKGKSENFIINMQVVNGEIQGFCIDDDKQSDNSATINGFMIDMFIGFIKNYPSHYYLDQKGIIQKDEGGPSYTVAYSGLYDQLTAGFRGIWHIENSNNWGEWVMMRKPD